MRINWRLFTVSAVLLVSALLIPGGWRKAAAPSRVPAPRMQDGPNSMVHGRGGDFILFNQDDQPWSLASERGKVVLLYFGYTSCADACPLMMSKVARAYRQLGSDASRISTVFVSVDRERDTPDVLKEYVSAYSIPITALTGSKLQIDRATSLYRAGYKVEHIDSATRLSVGHSKSLFVIDQRGRLRERYADDVMPSQIASGVKQLLDAER